MRRLDDEVGVGSGWAGGTETLLLGTSWNCGCPYHDTGLSPLWARLLGLRSRR